MDQNPCYVELMGNLARYRKHSDQAVTAVQLDLDTTGFVYQKWGAEQRCKQGDWLVDNNGDTYTIDSAVFARTYRKVAPGRFVKTTPVWVRRADHDGSIKTIEGESHYRTGDYLVFNNEDGTDGYCMSADSFHAMYEMDSPA